MERPPGSELQKQAIWLYGVLVGLAIKEAITRVYDHSTVPEPQHFWAGTLEWARLAVFLLLIIRFYLGSVQYFYSVYRSPKADTSYPDKSFGKDFLLGFGHFVVFCLLALSLTLHGSSWWFFPALVGIVLLYDVWWYLWSAGLSTRRAIRLWMVTNVVTVLSAFVFFVVPAFCFMFLRNSGELNLTLKQAGACELIAYVPVVLASAIDLGAVLTGRSAIEQWLSDALHRPEMFGGPARRTETHDEIQT